MRKLQQDDERTQERKKRQVNGPPPGSRSINENPLCYKGHRSSQIPRSYLASEEEKEWASPTMGTVTIEETEEDEPLHGSSTGSVYLRSL